MELGFEPGRARDRRISGHRPIHRVTPRRRRLLTGRHPLQSVRHGCITEINGSEVSLPGLDTGHAPHF